MLEEIVVITVNYSALEVIKYNLQENPWPDSLSISSHSAPFPPCSEIIGIIFHPGTISMANKITEAIRVKQYTPGISLLCKIKCSNDGCALILASLAPL